jgi:non-ribosomal peptide synthetase component E (peptide arylation enzyme)
MLKYHAKKKKLLLLLIESVVSFGKILGGRRNTIEEEEDMAMKEEEAKCAANYTALTPLSFIERTASVYGERDAVIYGDIRFTWTQTFERCRRLASAVSKLAAVGDTVGVFGWFSSLPKLVDFLLLLQGV